MDLVSGHEAASSKFKLDTNNDTAASFFNGVSIKEHLLYEKVKSSG